MQLLASPSYAVPAQVRRQPAVRTRLAAVLPYTQGPKAVASISASATVGSQHADNEVMPPSAHPPQPTAESQHAALAPLKPDETPGGFLSQVGKTLACLAVAAVLCFGNAGSALALSGGRAGGSSFHSAPSRSFSSSSSSGRSSSSYSSGFSSGSSFGSSYRPPAIRSGPRTSTTTIISVPGPSYAPYTPYYSPSPYITSPSLRGPSVTVVAPLTGEDVAVLLVVATIMFMFLAAPTLRMPTLSGGSTYSGSVPVASKYTVARVQIGTLAVAHQLKVQLNHIANRADTSSPQGLHAMLQDVIKALQKDPEYFVLGDSGTRQVGSPQAAERVYNEFAVDVRSAFDEESLVNVGGKPVRQKPLSAESDSIDELMVVSLVVAGEGAMSLPPLKSVKDVETVLARLAALSADELKAVELTWTPQAKGDALSQEEVLEKFPRLKPLL